MSIFNMVLFMALLFGAFYFERKIAVIKQDHYDEAEYENEMRTQLLFVSKIYGDKCEESFKKLLKFYTVQMKSGRKCVSSSGFDFGQERFADYRSEIYSLYEEYASHPEQHIPPNIRCKVGNLPHHMENEFRSELQLVYNAYSKVCNDIEQYYSELK